MTATTAATNKDFRTPTAIAWDDEMKVLTVAINAPPSKRNGKVYKRWYVGFYNFSKNPQFCQHMADRNGFYHNIMLKDVSAWVGIREQFIKSKVIIRKSLTITQP